MQKFGDSADAEKEPRLGHDQQPLKHTDHDGRGMLLVPFSQVDRSLAKQLTVSARNVPICVVRDFGVDRIMGYQKSTTTTHGRVIRNSNVQGLEAYVAAVINPHAKRRKDTMFAVGVATISLARPIPSGDIEIANDLECLNDIFGSEESGAIREGIVGTFWNGIPDFMTERAERSFLQSSISTQIAGLLVPRMVELGKPDRRTAYTFVASQSSGKPDTSEGMRDYMDRVATGRWSEPVNNAAVEYDLLVA